MDDRQRIVNLAREKGGNKDFRWAQLDKLRLRDADLSGINLTYASLNGAFLRGSKFEDGVIEFCFLENASLRYAECKFVSLRASRLNNTDMYGGRFQSSNFRDVYMSNADASYAHFEDADFTMAKLNGTDFFWSKMEKVKLDLSSLIGANFTKAELKYASFKNANLTDVCFEDADLTGVNFDKANLTNVNFGGAKVQGSSFTGAYTEYNGEKFDYIAPYSLTATECAPKIEQSIPYYMFIDTETTGPPDDYNESPSNTAKWPRLVQVALIIYSKDQHFIYSTSYIVKPEGYQIPEASTAIHGIDNERAKSEGKNLQWVLEKVIEEAEHVSAFVGHNIEFDLKVIASEMYRVYDQNKLPSLKNICTMKLATNYCEIPSNKGYKWPTLSELYYRLFDAKLVDAHQASVDVEATSRCFWKLKELGVINKDDIEEVSDFPF